MMPNASVTVYTPDSVLRSPHKLIGGMVRDLFAGRELAWRLTVRDVSAQYRQTVLGILWVIILPVANTITWLFLNSSGVIAIGDTDLPYSVYVFTGSMLWSIFLEAANAPLQKVIASKSMLVKLNFPREALIVSGIYQTLFNGAIKIGLLLVVLVIFKIYPGWNLLLFPVGVLSLVLAGTMAGLVITPLGLLYADVGKAMPLLFQFLMYATPVVFPMPTAGIAAQVFRLNPLTPLVVTARDWLTGTTPLHQASFWCVNGVLVLLLILMWLVVRVAMPILIERMGV